MSSETEEHWEINVTQNYSDVLRAPIISKVKKKKS